jgi:branched-chain amino acid transport system permease protein
MGEGTDIVPGAPTKSLLSKAGALTERFRILIVIAGLAAVIVFGAFTDDLGTLGTLTNVLMFIVLAQAWNILGGYGGYLNLGMAAFFGLGAYAAGILSSRYGTSPFITVPFAGAAAVVFGVLVGLPSLRLRGPYFAILTLVIGFLMQTITLNARITRGAMGIYLKPFSFSPRVGAQLFYFVYLILAVAVVLVVYRIEHSKYGYALVAIREDEEAAEILGVRTTWLKIVALLIGAFIAGIAGAVYGYRIKYIEPFGTFSLAISIDVVLMSLVGGAGTWQGPVIGVPLVMLVAEVLRVGVTRLDLFGMNVPTEFNRVVFGVILVLVAMFAREGIVGLFRGVRGRRFTV